MAMDSVKQIQHKLKAFIVKYYINALIKGSILFVVFGVLYLFFILFIEYALWLKPLARTLLFFIFISVEVGLLLFYILFPCFKILGLQKGLDSNQASKLIGKHFNEVGDKLLNLVQLQQDKAQTELLLASIEQKASGLLTVKFSNAINFKQNIKFLKFLTLPIIMIIVIGLSGKLNPFKQSLNRVVNYQKPFSQPPPFKFKLETANLKIIEGQDLLLNVSTEGAVVPSQAEIIIDGQSFFLKNEDLSHFSFLFENILESFNFYLKANEVTSQDYQIEVLRKPIITGFRMFLSYPKYVKQQDEIINNTGNATVPEGTIITWELNTAKTTKLAFVTQNTQEPFKNENENQFKLIKKLTASLNYQINTSNKQLKDFEKLGYGIVVVKDEFPKISLTSDIDSAQFNMAQFAGQISDDYGLSKLEFVYTNLAKPEWPLTIPIAISNASFNSFYYLLDTNSPDLNLIKGAHYQFYFKVYDNDGVNGSKFTKSKIFEFYNKTDIETESSLLQAQKQSISLLQDEKVKSKKLDESVKKITDKLKSQSNFKWDDVQQIKDLIARQKKEQELINNHIDNLKNNLNQDSKPSKNEAINEKQEDLNKRLEEAQQLLKQEKDIEDLRKLSEKLDKDGLLNKLDKFNQQTKQNNRTIERILELTKRFYIEKKLANISEDLKVLSKEQDSLANSKDNNLSKQEAIEQKFDKLSESLKKIDADNKSLTKPMDLPKIQREEFQVKEGLKDSKKQLQTKNQKEAVTKQKETATKMSQMGEKLQQSMEGMDGEMQQENILTLKTILDNLIIFSLDQETLMNDFKNIDDKHPDFSKKLRQQKVLKDYFEHVDDSIYNLSLRMPRLSVQIQNEITDTHYNINSALKNLAENNIPTGISNQQYAMTSANNLALILNQLLDQMQNENQSMGKGKKGSESQSFSLPDIIKKQSELIKDVQDGTKKGLKPGNSKESLSEAQYEIYKQQEALKQALNEILKNSGESGNQGEKAKKMMDDLQQQLLDKGFTNNVLQQMTDLQHELLKLETAQKKQGVDIKREAITNTKTFVKPTIKPLDYKDKNLNKPEILNRKPLMLKLPYQKRVQQYFKDSI